MRILYHHRIGSKDGQYVHVEELTEALKRLGHEIVMVGPSGVQKERFGYDSGAIAHLKRWMPKSLYESLEYLYGVLGYRRLRQAVIRHRPDCLYERYSLFLTSGARLKRRFGLPMLVEVNAPLWAERSKYDGISLSRLARFTEHTSWRNADRVLPVTEVLAGHVRRAGVPDSSIVVIPNGVNLRRFPDTPDPDKAKDRLGLAGRLVLGFTGFAREWHGLQHAVEFVGRHRDHGSCHLLVVGDGPARAELERRARSLGASDRVTFTGIVERDRVVDYIAAFDVALQPAVVAYASPLKLFEYLALGRPVVAPATPNIREILTHDRDAVLFEPGDANGFRSAVARLCGDPDLRRRIGNAARRLINDRGLTWERNAERVIELYRDLGVRDPK